MMSAPPNFRVVFPEWYDERGEWEAKEKGWLQGVEVHFANGDVQPLFFYDPVRLAQDMEGEAKYGTPFIAHPGLILIPEITREGILSAIKNLVDAAYFPIRSHFPATVNGVIHHSGEVLPVI
jgi:hypothetical protein